MSSNLAGRTKYQKKPSLEGFFCVQNSSKTPSNPLFMRFFLYQIRFKHLPLRYRFRSTLDSKNAVWFAVRTAHEGKDPKTVLHEPLKPLISCGFQPIFRDAECAVCQWERAVRSVPVLHLALKDCSTVDVAQSNLSTARSNASEFLMAKATLGQPPF